MKIVEERKVKKGEKKIFGFVKNMTASSAFNIPLYFISLHTNGKSIKLLMGYQFLHLLLYSIYTLAVQFSNLNIKIKPLAFQGVLIFLLWY